MNFPRLVGVLKKIFSKGPIWFLMRGKSEISSPQLRFMKNLMTASKKIKRSILNLIFKDKRLSDEYVTAVYDLNRQPESFDFAFFLIAAELFARENGKKSFIVLVVPAENIVEATGTDEYTVRWRLENIVFPLIGLCPTCIGYSVLPKKSSIAEMVKGKLVYPEFYDGNYSPSDFHKEVYQSKVKFTGLCASVEGVRYIKAWKKFHNLTGKIVTITLRQYLYDSIRDSNIDEWVKFAELISRDKFIPVFIPDTFSCFEQDNRLDGFIVFREPCWNLGLRMALYEESYLNFFVANGPSIIAHLNKKVASVGMRWLVPGSIHASQDSYEAKGVSVGQREYSFSEGHQVLSWKEDTVENICEEFNGFLANH